MSEVIPPDDAQMARAAYDRMLAETRKFSAEQNKLAEEAGKFAAEQNKLAVEQSKLSAEAMKFERERTTLAMTAGAAILGAGAVIGGLIVRLLTGH